MNIQQPSRRVLTFPQGMGLSVVSRTTAATGNGLLNNLIAYWPLNEAGGANNALDAHTNSLTLTQVDSPGASTGKVYSTARSFDGSADYFYRTSQSLLVAGDVELTFAGWIYLDDISVARPIVTKDDLASSREYSLHYRPASNAFRWLVSSNGTSTGSVDATTLGVPSTSTWYFFVCWHDPTANTLNIQFNNGTVDSTSYSSGITNAFTTPFQIGMFTNLSTYFYHDGLIGPISMWKSAAGGGAVLTAAQRTALYNSGNGLTYAAYTS